MNRSSITKVTALALTLVLMGGLLALLATGCGGNTPSSAASDMVQKLTDHQFGDAYDAFANSSSLRSQLTREQFVAQFEATLPEGSRIEDFSLSEEKIDGDKATVSWKATVKIPNSPDQPLDEKFQLVNEDGAWKVSA